MTSSPEENGLSPASTHSDLDAADNTGFAAWARVWAELGVVCPSQEAYEALIRHYCEPHRAYHNLQHLKECLHVRRVVNTACQACAEIDLALWFHDAIYDPLRSDNELRSAQWLDDVARDSGLGDETRRRLYDLVMVTRHDGAPASADEAVLVDTDLTNKFAASTRLCLCRCTAKSDARSLKAS
ncbi:HD domain-containing protein [Pseudomonas sp. EA_15y_Pfl2_R67]|uniref:HD domain-containing protein n=1 Tax=Pseudomonas sp. EA_15y_Pfl2_R67 TaxID=3088687 RepID=UPI0030D9D1C5